MNFGFSEEQDLIRKSARDFTQKNSSLERVRMDLETELGYSRSVWRQMADNGWLGCTIPEEFGGIQLGYVDLLCIEEELGQGLMPEPILSSAVLGGEAVLNCCNEKWKSELLPQAAAGELTLAVAAYELRGRYEFKHVETIAKTAGDGFVLDGVKSFVADAASANRLIVSARTSDGKTDKDGISLFLLDHDTPGLTIKPVQTMDRRKRAHVELKDVKVSKERVLGEVGKAYANLDKTLDRATVVLCAEMLGGMQAALDMSLQYAQQRVQFGRTIGSFQAIKHKMANMFVALEAARSTAYYAAMAIDAGDSDAKAAVSCAKAMCSDAFVNIGKETIQIHGGIGFTDEHNAHLYYKRALVSAVTLGDADWHRERYLQEKGI